MEVPNYNRDATARQVAQPNIRPRLNRPARRQVLSTTPWTFQDKLPYFVAVIALIVVAFSVITFSNQKATAQKTLTETNSKITANRNNNNNLKQDIATLTSTDRLTQIAQEFGLSMNVSNVRNVR